MALVRHRDPVTGRFISAEAAALVATPPAEKSTKRDKKQGKKSEKKQGKKHSAKKGKKGKKGNKKG